MPEPTAATVTPTAIDPRLYREMGLIDSEYDLIVQTLGRQPTYTEIGMYSVMWSEHCGYKYSRPVLKLFADYKKAQETGALENAGVVPLGETGWGVVFKMESHNHPSAVEPYQGAATGVGGILRDIFTMGARPIASLDSLRFGPITGDGPEVARNRYLFEHIVGGVGGYGNCVGVPTVGGEITFAPCYSGNPLVNALSIGVVPLDKVTSARASGVGNPVLYVGSATGRDGIHGATFASVELTEESEAKRPNVQVGDPFTEKLLIEATLEALQTGWIVGIQDMGAAGLTCATSEMAAKGGLGMDVDVRAVPLREADMTPYEIMLSESQERMLAVVAQGHEDEVAHVFRKWGLSAAYIGTITDTGRVVIRDGETVAADIPARSLADDCPTYYLDAAEPAYLQQVQNVDLTALPEPDDYNAVLLRLLASPTIASKRWVWEQYDSMVQTQTEIGPGGGDAAVLTVREAIGHAPSGQSGQPAPRIAATTDCNSRFCYLDPFAGAQLAVAEAARNLSCVGAVPKAVTDCLNFPSPGKAGGLLAVPPRGRGNGRRVRRLLNTQVVSGNVSFYNETPEGAIYPTPTVGMVGVFDARRLALRRPGLPELTATCSICLRPSRLVRRGVGHRRQRVPVGDSRTRRGPHHHAWTSGDRNGAGAAHVVRQAIAAGTCSTPPTTAPRAGWPSRSPNPAWRAARARKCASPSPTSPSPTAPTSPGPPSSSAKPRPASSSASAPARTWTPSSTSPNTKPSTASSSARSNPPTASTPLASSTSPSPPSATPTKEPSPAPWARSSHFSRAAAGIIQVILTGERGDYGNGT